MKRLKALQENVSKQLEDIHEQIIASKQRQTIPCASCGKRHVIGKTTVIQTMWYTPPYGCTGGDYWNYGELAFDCKECGIRNRFLFNDIELPYEMRNQYKWNLDKQFSSGYKHCFGEVIEEHDDKHKPLRFINNYYIDKNRKRFDLFENKKAIMEYHGLSK